MTPDPQAIDHAIHTLDTFIRINRDKIKSASAIIHECRYDEQGGEEAVGELTPYFGPVVCASVSQLLTAYCQEWEMLIEQQTAQRAELSRIASQMRSGIVIPQPLPRRN